MKVITKYLALGMSLLLLVGCVDQHICLENDTEHHQRIVATSIATVEIMEKLGVDLVGVPESNNASLPTCYADLPKIGTPMMPDIEAIKALNSDYVFGPASLISDLLPKYRAADIDYGFLNLNNIDGMYASIKDLGILLGKQSEAQKLIESYETYKHHYQQKIANREPKKVLILMGLPGSYVVATENSYVGSLVKMAGAENVYAGTNQDFLTINTEDMLTKDPDIILRSAHALPQEVKTMFEEDFASNDIWQHFRAVKSNRVYDLDYNKFGMSAKFNYPEALEDLETILYD